MVEPPTGVVTLVFTDVQGSTALWDRIPGPMKEALALHDAVVRQAIDDAGGYEVKTEGDAFMVAFASAKAAVDWCLQVQVDLLAAAWPAEILDQAEAAELHSEAGKPLMGGLRVRMGVHTGEPHCKPDPITGRMDYFGGMVNRAARVGAAGHGGQVLVSGATWDQISAAPVDSAVVDLGEHALQGLERREQLRQILPEALQQRSFARLKTPDLKKTNLPRRVDSFVGRRDETGEIANLFKEGARLVTVLGAGGTGKTRLSQRVAAVLLADYPGGSWFVDLSEASDESGIIAAFSNALEVALTQADEAQQIGDALRGRGRLLVVVDNVEQVVDAAAVIVGRWLQQAPDVQFLATSRIRMNVEGEQIFYLDPLPEAEAIQLFEDRAAAVKPGFRVNDSNRAAIAQIVDRLDRVSLAIELAAARVRMLPPEKLLARLSERFKLLQGKRRDQSARQATLRGAIDWSWQLLKPWEQLALAQCSVFEGGFSLEAAEGVLDLSAWDDAPWPMDVVETLVDHSLLRHHEPFDGQERFTIFRSIQEYAQEKHGEPGAVLSKDGDSLSGPQPLFEAQRRHAAWFAELGGIEDTGRSLQQTDEGLRHGVLEHENLQIAVQRALRNEWVEEALGCCTAVVHTAQMIGPYRRSVDLAEQALALPGKATNQRAYLALRCCVLQILLGRIQAARRAMDDASAKVVDPGLYLQFWLHFTEGRVLEHEGQFEPARALVEKAQALALRLGNRFYQLMAAILLAGLDMNLGRLAPARAQFAAARIGMLESESTVFARNADMNLALLDLFLGRLEASAQAYHQLAESAKERGSSVDQGVSLVNLGLVTCLAHQFDASAAHFDDALALAKEIGTEWIEAWALAWKGRVLHAQGRYDDSLALIEQALTMFERTGDARGRSHAQTFLAALQRDQGALDQASQSIAQARLFCDGVGDPLLSAQARAVEGTIAVARGDRTLAKTCLSEAHEVALDKEVLADSDLCQRIETLRSALEASA